jgi:hypothetical protein
MAAMAKTYYNDTCRYDISHLSLAHEVNVKIAQQVSGEWRREEIGALVTFLAQPVYDHSGDEYSREEGRSNTDHQYDRKTFYRSLTKAYRIAPVRKVVTLESRIALKALL